LGGRLQKLDDKKVAMAKSMLKDPETTVTQVAETLGVMRAMLYRALARSG
jgi:DNA-binding phage protein